MTIVQFLLAAILIVLVLFLGEANHQLLRLRTELRDQAKRSQGTFNEIELPPKEPRKSRKPGMPTI